MPGTARTNGPESRRSFLGESGEPDRIRTCDPLIKSQLLYQLSYRPTQAASLGGHFGTVKCKTGMHNAALAELSAQEYIALL